MTGKRSAPVLAVQPGDGGGRPAPSAVQDFRDEVDGRWSASHLAEFADIQRRDIDGLVEHRATGFLAALIRLLNVSRP